MKYLTILPLLTVSLFANECIKVFPDVFSSQTTITLNSYLDIGSISDKLQTPILNQTHPKSKCDGKRCEATQTSPNSLALFEFQASSIDTTTEVDKDIIYDQEEIGNIIITGDNITVTFKAPASTKGLFAIQKIGAIKVEGKNVTLIFEGGDYHIKSFTAESTNTPKGKIISLKDTLTMTPNGNVRFFIDEGFYISKTNLNAMDKSLLINTQTKTKTDKLLGFIPMKKREVTQSKKLIIYAKGEINIKSVNGYEINALIYGYGDVKLSSNPQSNFSGAIHAGGDLTIEKENGLKGGNFVYDEDGVKELWKLFSCQALPDEPDVELNNSTLLGIDSNNNGIRDDVEIYIVKRFSQDLDFPKTKIAIAMQYAWANQKLIENPIMSSDKYSNDVIDCEYYWIGKHNKNMTTLKAIQYHQKHKIFNDNGIKDKSYNTKERIKEYFKFNQACSGHIFDGRDEDTINNCQINIDRLGE